MVAYKKALEIDPEDQDSRTRLLSIQSPMYNSDNTNMLYMKFPQFRVQNNLVIDKKYKKPQNQRALQNQMQNVPGMGGALGGIGGDPMQIPSQMPQSSVTSSNIAPISPIGQDYQNPQMNQIPNRGNPVPQSNPYEEEKYASQQYTPQQYGQNISNQSYDYNANRVPSPYHNNPNSSHDNLNRSYDHHSQSRPTMPPQQNYNRDPQPNYQPPNYNYDSQYSGSKLQKVDEFGQGQQPSQNYQGDGGNFGMQNLQVQQNRYMPENNQTLNQLSKGLNTQNNLPSLQSSGMQSTQNPPLNTQNVPQSTLNAPQYSQNQGYNQNNQSQGFNQNQGYSQGYNQNQQFNQNDSRVSYRKVND